mmetsp:Transcript_87115/g.208390  ORF Transcript_87115/g.208390 Transcript_87115/m.208390 type:complete len:237 (+) Transcript_87115:1082-1792(+)
MDTRDVTGARRDFNDACFLTSMFSAATVPFFSTTASEVLRWLVLDCWLSKYASTASSGSKGCSVKLNLKRSCSSRLLCGVHRDLAFGLCSTPVPRRLLSKSSQGSVARIPFFRGLNSESWRRNHGKGAVKHATALLSPRDGGGAVASRWGVQVRLPSANRAEEISIWLRRWRRCACFSACPVLRLSSGSRASAGSTSALKLLWSFLSRLFLNLLPATNGTGGAGAALSARGTESST